MPDHQFFWIVQVYVGNNAHNQPNPVGILCATRTIDQAKEAAYTYVNRPYVGTEYSPIELKWHRIQPEGNVTDPGPWLGEEAVTPMGDFWSVWPVTVVGE